MTDTRNRAVVVATLAFLLVWPLALWAVMRNAQPWGDEVHFLETVRLFGQGITIDLLRTYPELSAPLAYVVYAQWGHVVGFSTPALRLLSPLLAFAVACIWFFVLRRFSGSTWLTLLTLAIVVFNPYFVGLSVFVFTDMLALLGLVMVTWGVQTSNRGVVAAGLAVATLTRQYLAFLAPAVTATALLCEDKPADKAKSILAIVLGMIPLAYIVWLWDGKLAPANVVSQLYLSEGVRYDPHALSLYLASPAVYLAPLVIFVIRRAHWKTWAAAVVVSLFVALVPVQPSLAQTRDGIFTVGFFHRALVATLPSQLVNLVFVLAAAVSLTALFRMGEAFLRRWRDGSVASTEVFLWLSTIAFWLLMPFSFMPWEKYGLPLYMLIGALLLSYLAKGLDRGHGRQDLFGRPANLLGRAPDL